MKENKAIQFINQFFVNVDKKEWEKVADCFDDFIVADYSYLNEMPKIQEKEKVLKGWQSFFSKYDSLHHQLGNYIYEENGEIIKIFTYVTAYHMKKINEKDEILTVIGEYDIEIIDTRKNYKISKIKLNVKFADGDCQM